MLPELLRVSQVPNNGFLPTYTSRKALERWVVRPIEVELSLPADVSMVSGKWTRRQDSMNSPLCSLFLSLSIERWWPTTGETGGRIPVSPVVGVRQWW
jgi:hypothetical protein